MVRLGNGGGDILSNWLSFGKKQQKRGLEMNGEHYMFYGSQLTWIRSCSMPATVTPIFPSEAMVLHVLWLFFLEMLTKLLYSIVYQIILLQNLLQLCCL